MLEDAAGVACACLCVGAVVSAGGAWAGSGVVAGGGPVPVWVGHGSADLCRLG